MIRINLLPPESAVQAPKKINPALALGIAIPPVLIGLGIRYASIVKDRNAIHAQANDLQAQVEGYRPVISQLEALQQTKTQLTQRKNVIQQLESERLRYPKFMEDLLKLLPANLWITSLSTTIINDQQINIQMSIMALDNYAIADLISNLESSQIFSDIDLGSISFSQSTANTAQTLTTNVTASYKPLAGGNILVKRP